MTRKYAPAAKSCGVMGVGIVLVVMWKYYSGIFVIWCATTYYNTGWLLLQLSSWLFYFSNFFFKWTAKLRLIFDNLIINFSFFSFWLTQISQRGASFRACRDLSLRKHSPYANKSSFYKNALVVLYDLPSGLYILRIFTENDFGDKIISKL